MATKNMNEDTKVRTQRDVEQLEFSYTTGGNVKSVENWYGRFLQS